MIYKKNFNWFNFGKITGFIVLYFLFTTIFYFVFKFRFIRNLNYFFAILITTFILIMGISLKKFLQE